MKADLDMKNDENLENGLSGGDEQEIIGYTEPWIASAGQRVEVKVSSLPIIQDMNHIVVQTQRT